MVSSLPVSAWARLAMATTSGLCFSFSDHLALLVDGHWLSRLLLAVWGAGQTGALCSVGVHHLQIWMVQHMSLHVPCLLWGEVGGLIGSQGMMMVLLLSPVQ